MDLVMSYLWTLLIGLAGAGVGVALRFPAGALVGSTLAVALVNGFVDKIEIVSPPTQVRLVLQVGLGIIIGSRFTREAFFTLKDLWQPALLCAAIAISAGILSGLLVSRWLGVEQLSAFLGSAPGGLSDLSLIALDMGAQGSTVLVMHLVRLVCVILIVPWVVRFVVSLQSG